MKQLFCEPSNQRTICDRHKNGVRPVFIEPESHGFAGTAASGSDSSIVRVLDQVQSKKKERVTQAIIGTRLGNDDLLELARDVFVGELAFHNAVRQDRVRRCDAGSNRHCEEKWYVWS